MKISNPCDLRSGHQGKKLEKITQKKRNFLHKHIRHPYHVELHRLIYIDIFLLNMAYIEIWRQVKVMTWLERVVTFQRVKSPWGWQPEGREAQNFTNVRKGCGKTEKMYQKPGRGVLPPSVDKTPTYINESATTCWTRWWFCAISPFLEVNPISGRLLATPISGKGGLFRTPPWYLEI